jgi:hypothetical protein
MKSKKLVPIVVLSVAAFFAAGQSANAQSRHGQTYGSYGGAHRSHVSEFRHGGDRHSRGGRASGYARPYNSGYGYPYRYSYAPPYSVSGPGYYVDDYYPGSYYPPVAYPSYRNRVIVALPSPHRVLRRLLDPLGVFDGHRRHFGR